MSDLTTVLKKNTRIDISDDMSDSFYTDLKIRKGKILTFKDGDEIKHFRIVRLNRKLKKCEVVETRLYKEDEVEVVDGTSGR